MEVEEGHRREVGEEAEGSVKWFQDDDVGHIRTLGEAVEARDQFDVEDSFYTIGRFFVGKDLFDAFAGAGRVGPYGKTGHMGCRQEIVGEQ